MHGDGLGLVFVGSCMKMSNSNQHNNIKKTN